MPFFFFGICFGEGVRGFGFGMVYLGYILTPSTFLLSLKMEWDGMGMVWGCGV